MAEGNVEKVIADNEQSLLNQVTDLSFLDSVRPLYLNNPMSFPLIYFLSRVLKGLLAS